MILINKCHSYHEIHGVKECLGTKERDECSCGGDRSRCDFYSNVKPEKKVDDNTSEPIEIKDIQTMSYKKFNDMIGELLNIRYPEAKEVSVTMQKYSHGADFFTGATMSRKINVVVEYD